MKKLKSYVFSAIVILMISFSDKAESKSMEIDQRLERAVEAWRNGTSFAQADTDTDTDTSDSDDSDKDTDTSSSSDSNSDTEDSDTDTDTSSSSSSDSDTEGSNRQAEVTDPKTGIKYGCYWSHCWRSCKKGEHILDNSGQDLCVYNDNGNHWCYSDLGRCTYASGCQDAVKWGCYGTGGEPGRIVPTGCPFKGYPCDTKTKRSFGCSKIGRYGNNRCWRSCDSKKEKSKCPHKGYCKNQCNPKGYCYVEAGACSFNERCVVATALECSIRWL